MSNGVDAMKSALSNISPIARPTLLIDAEPPFDRRRQEASTLPDDRRAASGEMAAPIIM